MTTDSTSFKAWISSHPRLVALGMIALGVAAVAAILAIMTPEPGSRTDNRAIFLVGIGGIAAGVGVTQLIWPPRPDTGDGRNAFSRAPWPQKILWVVGGLVGVVAAAVAVTAAGGNI